MNPTERDQRDPRMRKRPFPILCAATASLLMSGVAWGQPTETIVLVPRGASAITVSLPIANFDTSVPSSTVIIQPVLTTLIDPTTPRTSTPWMCLPHNGIS